MDENNVTAPPPAPTPAPAPAPSPIAPEHNTLMAVLAYISILVVVPWVTAKDDPFVAYHIRQGLVLLIIEVALWVLMHFLMLYMFWYLFQLVNLGVLVLAIIGIMHAVRGEQKELPLVGHFAGNIKI